MYGENWLVIQTNHKGSGLKVSGFFLASVTIGQGLLICVPGDLFFGKLQFQPCSNTPVCNYIPDYPN